MNQKVALMQPYLFPYIGYFQLISAVDLFVFYDDCQYMKGGWINSNRIKRADTDYQFTISLKKGGHTQTIAQRFYHEKAKDEMKSLMGVVYPFYKRAPFKDRVFQLIEEFVQMENQNLSEVNIAMVQKVCQLLKIKTRFSKSSDYNLPMELRSSAKVLEIVRRTHGTTYVNPIGGLELYSEDEFAAQGIQLHFLKSKLRPYPQQGHGFVPGLSILDLLANCSDDELQAQLLDYELI